MFSFSFGDGLKLAIAGISGEQNTLFIDTVAALRAFNYLWY